MAVELLPLELVVSIYELGLVPEFWKAPVETAPEAVKRGA